LEEEMKEQAQTSERLLEFLNGVPSAELRSITLNQPSIQEDLDPSA